MVEERPHRETQQAIIMRKFSGKDVPRGKEIVQGSHGSMKFVGEQIIEQLMNGSDAAQGSRRGHYVMKVRLTPQMAQWFVHDNRTKVCFKVHTEMELFQLKKKAEESGIAAYMVTDMGKTIFEGEPTNTALVLGPDWKDKIYEITKDLKLY